MSDAAIGHGSAFAIGDGAGPEVFTEVAEVTSITPPNFVRDTVDATHMASPDKWREYVGGLRDAGTVSITVNFVPGGAAQDAIIAKFTADTVSNFKITFPNAEAWTFAAWCTGFATEDPLEGKMTATATFKLSGKPAFV
jgi:predicted secreted protein